MHRIRNSAVGRKLLTLLIAGLVFASVGAILGLLFNGLTGLAWGAVIGGLVGIFGGLFVGPDRGMGAGIPDITGDRHNKDFKRREGDGR